MPTPRVFISHRWDNPGYNSLVTKFNQYGFEHRDYSVPSTNPLDAVKISLIKAGLKEQIRQCNYFLIFANMAQERSMWCKFEIEVAKEYYKPILSIRPHAYTGNIPIFIQQADNEGGTVGFSTPAIIRKICFRLNYPVPFGV